MKQTAVEWLIAELIKTIDYDDSQNVEDLRIKLQSFSITSEKHAKKLEKQQIENAFRIGATTELTFGDNKAEQYYIKEYGGEQ